jgi:CelD/BcsL family acetyltransferase involved in cellulose biosynthesis
LIQESSELEPLQASWDELAVAVRSPFAAPAWAAAWWRHLSPDGARLAVVAVHAGDQLVGLAPFYASRRLGVTELRLLSGGFASRPGILARSGHERDVADAIPQALADANLRPDALRWEAVDAASPWPDWLSSGWPDGRGHRLLQPSERSAPVVHIGSGSFDEWLDGKSSKFRRRMRRNRRNLEEEEGATFRSADAASLGHDLESFSRLHSARWEDRGGSSAVSTGTLPMLQEVGERLLESGRFRLLMIDAPDGDAINAELFIAAGGVVADWSGGFDERWGKHSPGVLGILAGVEDAFAHNDELVDLGGGEAGFKDRIADEDRPVAWRTSYRRGMRYPLARLRDAPEQAARRGGGRLREWLGQEKLGRLRKRLRR